MTSMGARSSSATTPTPSPGVANAGFGAARPCSRRLLFHDRHRVAWPGNVNNNNQPGGRGYWAPPPHVPCDLQPRRLTPSANERNGAQQQRVVVLSIRNALAVMRHPSIGPPAAFYRVDDRQAERRIDLI